jgi:predicted DNA-binding protein
MQMQRLNIQFPRELKAKLDALRKQGTTASGLIRNLVERWFREITDKRIRRGVFRSVPELIAAIEDYMNNHNQNPRVFVWTASVESIMAKIAKCKEALDALH